MITDEIMEAARNMKGSVPTDANIRSLLEAVAPLIARQAHNAAVEACAAQMDPVSKGHADALRSLKED